MSTPPDQLMKLMGGGPKPGGAPMGAPPGAPGGAQPPAGGPMSTPQPKEGAEQAAMVNVAMTLQLLEHSLMSFGSATPKGKAILNALKTLTQAFGNDRQKSDALIPAELQQLMQSIPGAGGGSPAAKTMAAAPPGAPAMA